MRSRATACVYPGCFTRDRRGRSINVLVKLFAASTHFERGAAHVSATSRGPPALLLPVQFSHCFRLLPEQADAVKVLRANLIHTLILFTGELDVRLKWEFSFWRNGGCRLRDAEDVRALGLH
jgi:hypothetical protein